MWSLSALKPLLELSLSFPVVALPLPLTTALPLSGGWKRQSRGFDPMPEQQSFTSACSPSLPWTDVSGAPRLLRPPRCCSRPG